MSKKKKPAKTCTVIVSQTFALQWYSSGAEAWMNCKPKCGTFAEAVAMREHQMKLDKEMGVGTGPFGGPVEYRILETREAVVE